ncbi:hypothetical protein [Kribbella capetownensis]|nr:hypothetical protein [Kribbella capetownensis]
MDYVQLRFDSIGSDELPVLNCDVMPGVQVGDSRLYDGDVGYSDALRSFIPGRVVATVEETGRGLQIDFAGGSIVLHPRSDELVSPEIAMLGGFEDRSFMVWRPGEDSFEDLG